MQRARAGTAESSLTSGTGGAACRTARAGTNDARAAPGRTGRERGAENTISAASAAALPPPAHQTCTSSRRLACPCPRRRPLLRPCPHSRLEPPGPLVEPVGRARPLQRSEPPAQTPRETPERPWRAAWSPPPGLWAFLPPARRAEPPETALHGARAPEAPRCAATCCLELVHSCARTRLHEARRSRATRGLAVGVPAERNTLPTERLTGACADRPRRDE